MSKKEWVMLNCNIHTDWQLCVEAVMWDPETEGAYSHEKAMWVYKAYRSGAWPKLLDDFVNTKYEEDQPLFVGGVP